MLPTRLLLILLFNRLLIKFAIEIQSAVCIDQCVGLYAADTIYDISYFIAADNGFAKVKPFFAVSAIGGNNAHTTMEIIHEGFGDDFRIVGGYFDSNLFISLIEVGNRSCGY